MRIAVLHFSHETVTFLNSDTTVDDFIYQGSPASGEALLKQAVVVHEGAPCRVTWAALILAKAPPCHLVPGQRKERCGCSVSSGTISRAS